LRIAALLPLRAAVLVPVPILTRLAVEPLMFLTLLAMRLLHVLVLMTNSNLVVIRFLIPASRCPLNGGNRIPDGNLQRC
jgi:hypothetical protein